MDKPCPVCGRPVEIDPERDECLYRAPRCMPNPNLRYTEGTDLYCHKTPDGKVYFYLLRWNIWDEEFDIELLTEKKARKLLGTLPNIDE